MLINLSELLKSEIGSVLEAKIKIPPQKLGEEISLAQPLVGEAKLIKQAKGVLVHFNLSGVLKLLCFRCNNNFLKKIKIKFDQNYVWPKGSENVSFEEEQEEGFLIKPDNMLDPWPAIRQEIILSQPMKILCKPSCKGLCPVCGKDLNKGSCKHIKS